VNALNRRVQAMASCFRQLPLSNGFPYILAHFSASIFYTLMTVNIITYSCDKVQFLVFTVWFRDMNEVKIIALAVRVIFVSLHLKQQLLL
jgi:hypothetical protein